MKTAPSDDQLRPTEIAILCAVAVISNFSYAGLPAFVGAYGEVLHLDLATSGWLATAEGVGYALALLWYACRRATDPPPRLHIACFLLLLAVAQIASAAATTPLTLGTFRTLSGLTSGLVYATGTACIATRGGSMRAFSAYFGALFLSGPLALVLLPHSLPTFGLRGVYEAYAAIIVAGIGLVVQYPTRATPDPASPDVPLLVANPDALRTVWLLSTSVFLNFVFNGGIWILAERFGMALGGADATSLGSLLSLSMLLGLIGTGLAGVLNDRAGFRVPILASNIAMMLSVAVLTFWHAIAGLFVAMTILNVAVTVLTPAALAALARYDAHGPQWGVLGSVAGYGVGPALIAAIGADGHATTLLGWSLAGFFASAAVAWIAISVARPAAPVAGSPGGTV